MLQRESPWKKLDFVKRISKLLAHLFKLVLRQRILLMTSHPILAELRYVTVSQFYEAVGYHKFGY